MPLTEKINLLLVDDQPQNLLSLEALLDHPEYNLIKANSGREALRLVLKEEFALILLDVQMPDMDGFETARMIKAREKSKEVPIIFVTAISKETEYISLGYQTGGVDYIFKPYDPNILKAKVAAFVKMYKVSQDVKTQADQLLALNQALQEKIEEITRLNRDLEMTNKELETFSYSVSHDLRAPLRGLDGFATLLREEFADKLDENGRRYLLNIERAAERMNLLIEDLLKLSRITRMGLRQEEIDLSELAVTVSKEIQSNQPERAVEWVIQQGIKVTGDHHLLRIVLENLFGNAWKFTGKNPKALIEVGSIKTQEGKAAFFIRDNGAGFNMSQAGKLFTPFQRLHGLNEFEGTGIGLATVARIIRRHGGEVWAEGEEGKGATFYFTLQGGF
ncbi:MAG: response regulator [Deltaproteobacteria bacterium]|nr:response regulator [Deltaproteobacteria bacterium]